MRIGRSLSATFIVLYLSCLCLGIGAHAMKVGLSGRTLSYFFVWDMFCGWEAYDNRTRLVAEDIHGQYYDVRPPWGEFHPFGHVGRVHYDVSNNLVPKYIRHVLSHTSHPAIDRVYVVQEIWPKQFNLPNELWNRYYEEPRDPTSYYNLRAVCSSTGTLLNSYPDWFVAQKLKSVADNPRLQLAAQRAQPYYNTFVNPSRAAATSSPTMTRSASASTALPEQFSTN